MKEMTNTKHTPGPWEVDGFSVMAGVGAEYGDLAYATAGDGHADPDCHLNRPDAERLANATLIAAAPDLLAALEEIAEITQHTASREIALAAIAKARGE